MNEVRAKIYDLFAPLSEAFTQGKTVRDGTTALYELIEKLEIEQKLNKKNWNLNGRAIRSRRKSTPRFTKLSWICLIRLWTSWEAKCFRSKSMRIF